MRALTAMLMLTWRDAWRSRRLPWTIGILLALFVALDRALRGDGTALGEARVRIAYLMGVQFTVLALVALWHAAGVLPRDLAGRQLQLTWVKPVGAWRLWLGRWLGLWTMYGLLGLFCASLVAGALARHASRQPAGARAELQSDFFTARRRLPPNPPDVAARAGELAAQALAEGAIADAGLDATRRHIERQLAAQARAVAPGADTAWTFALPQSRHPAGHTPNAEWRLAYRVHPTWGDRQLTRGEWRIYDAAAPDAARWTFPVEGLWEGAHSLAIPAAALAGVTTARVAFVNAPESATAVFDAQAPPALLGPGGGFAANLLRATAVLLAYLALFCALGLTLGALFSGPVALFCAGALLAVAIMTHYFVFASAPEQTAYRHEHEHGESAPASAWRQGLDRAGHMAFTALGAVVEPLAAFDPITRLERAERIGMDQVGRAWWRLAGLGGLTAAGLAIWRLRRGELALPGRDE